MGGDESDGIRGVLGAARPGFDSSATAMFAAVSRKLFDDEAPHPRVGRYVLLERVGKGGMGEVFRAHDPSLDRTVAVKLMTVQSRRSAARLLREARAMAAVSHPNILPVYDVGLQGAQAFLAMELVDGQTLREWLHAERRSLTEILARFTLVGRGLGAAHAAGLVHRDFKPDNVMCGNDGRVRVMDFGLAKPLGTSELDTSDVVRTPDVDDVRLTRSDVVLGTPAYMSPEQHERGELGPASDQYSFCVSLFEAVCGALPFPGSTCRAMAAAKFRHAPVWPDGAEPPPWLRAALLRGLAPRPEDRWPSMEALLAALQRRRLWRAGVGVAAVAIGAMGTALFSVFSPGPACDAEAEIDAAWNEVRKANVREALLSTRLHYAHDTASRVESRIDGWVAEWIAARAPTCIAPAKDEARDRLVVCLRHRRWELAAVVMQLERADASTLERAVGLVSDMRSPAGCDDGSTLAPLAATVEEGAVEQIEAEIWRISVLARAGRYEESVAAAEALLPRAEATGHEPVAVAVLNALASAEHGAGQIEASERHGADAFHRAGATGLHREQVVAATMLANVISYRAPEEARAWVRHGLAALPPAELTGTADHVALLCAAGRVHGVLSQWPAAIEDYRAALALLDGMVTPDPLAVARASTGLANALAFAGEPTEAERHAERALEVLERSLGPDHPYVGEALQLLGGLMMVDDRAPQGLALLRRGLAVQEESLGADHLKIAVALDHLVHALSKRGEYEPALPVARRAVEIARKRLPGSRELAGYLNNLGALCLHVERWEEALAALEEAAAVYEQSEPGSDRYLAPIHINIGAALQRLDRHEEAIDTFRRAADMDPINGVAWAGMGESYARLGRDDEARAAFEIALPKLAGNPQREEVVDTIEGWLAGEVTIPRMAP